MRQVFEALRLVFDHGRSQREAGRVLGLSQSTINEYLRRFRASGLPWPLAPDADEVTVAARLFTDHTTPTGARSQPDWPTIHAELRPGLLCLADRYVLGFDLWQQAAATGAALVWRAKANQVFPVEARSADGSYRSTLRWNKHCRATDRTPLAVRVIEYTLPGVPDAEPSYRLVTTLLDPTTAPAAELAALYHERWEIETAFDALKTHLRGARIVLRSKTPDLVRQEAYGLLLAHFAVRGLMHEAALAATPTPRDPDTLSFVHAVRVLRRTLPRVAALPP